MSNFYQIIFGFLATMAFITMVDAWINAHATFYHDPESKFASTLIYCEKMHFPLIVYFYFYL